MTFAKLGGTILTSAFILVFAGCGSASMPTCQPGAKPPLVIAIEAGSRTQVAQLLKNGADPNEGQPPFGPPPLNIAMQKGDPEIISTLGQYGAKTLDELLGKWQPRWAPTRTAVDTNR